MSYCCKCLIVLLDTPCRLADFNVVSFTTVQSGDSIYTDQLDCAASHTNGKAMQKVHGLPQAVQCIRGSFYPAFEVPSNENSFGLLCDGTCGA